MVLGVILLILLISYFLSSLLDGIVLGTVFAYVGRPIRNIFRERKRLGSIVATVCIITPIAVILGLGTIEIASQILWLVEHQAELLHGFSLFLTDIGIPSAIYDELTGSLNYVIAAVTTVATRMLAPAFTYGRAMTHTILNFIVSIPVCYFLLIDGERLVHACISTTPVENIDLFHSYIARIDSILSGIFIGSIYTALLGSSISAIVFYSFDVPSPFALASFVFIAGLVPVLTSWMVILPVTVFRYVSLGYFDALTFFVVSSTLIYLPTELIIRPYLVSAKSTVHPLLVMLSFVGGMLVAGIGGFFLAPALMGVIVGIYQVNMKRLAEQEACKENDPARS